MKKYILLLALMSSLVFYAQQEKDSIIQNEFKINLAYLIAGYPELTYERLLSDESSIGISMLFSIKNNSSEDNNEGFNFSLIPYYRIYFGEQPNTGFFIDGNLALYSQKEVDGDLFSSPKKGGIGFGVGFGIGRKYKTRSGWVAEVSFGLTRTLINAENINLIYPRGGVTIGKQF